MERDWKKGLAAAVVGVGALLLAWAPVAAAADEKPKLDNGDCVKCHEGPPAAIAAAGGKHKDVACNDCHGGHRPASKNNIPECSQCHEGEPHYKLKGCLGCHKNPHTPLTLTLADNLTEPCLTCHTDQNKKLKDNKSKHSALACTKCHRVHRKAPECFQCHKPHAPEQTAADCKKCHKAHMPKVVTYAADLPNKDCSACHRRAFDLLTSSQAKHQRLTCVYCHKERHKAVPQCTGCHNAPHPAAIMVKFPKCGECHNIAHDLNHWTKAGKETVKAPKKK